MDMNLREYKTNWQRKWRKDNLEVSREQNRLSQHRNKARRLEYNLRPEVKKMRALSVAIWREKNPEKCRAHRIVYTALRNGSLQKESCFCGEVKVQAHHDDYSRPLDVVWLCKAHHAGADELRRIKLSTVFTCP